MSSGVIAALVADAFGGAGHPLAGWYAGLLAATPSLQQFTADHARKIRKKAHLATTPDAQRDLRCELAVAAALADRRSPLIYEPLAAAGRRGPDFLLRHKGHTEVYVEVSRLRPARSATRDPADRLAGALCGKLGQLAAGAANLLVLVSDDGVFRADAIAATIQGLRRRADAKDDAYFGFRGLEGARALFQTLPRLSGVLAVTPDPLSEALFLYPQIRHPLPSDLVRAITASRLGISIGPLTNEAEPDEP
jgi:hypothetical protein